MRVANSIFCEDIRSEIGNKISLMGVFASDILFPGPPPSQLPKFGAVVWLISERDNVPKKFSIRILVPPNRTELAKIDAEGELPLSGEPDEFSKHAVIRVIIPMANLVLMEEGYLELMVDTEDAETIRAGRLKIRFNVSADEMGLPAI
jgi:hypothetical protein